MIKILIVVSLSIIFFLSGCVAQNEPQAEQNILDGNDAKPSESGAQSERQESENVRDGNNAQSNANADQDDPQRDQSALIEGFDYIKIDQPAEDFTAWDFEGNEVQLSDYKGKIVFLYFWATWCGPCREKMPIIQEFYEEHKDQGVVVLAVSSTEVEMRGRKDADAAQDQVKRFIEENGFTFPVFLDRYSEGWKIYQQRGIPVNYVIDREGIVRFLRPGPYTDKQQMVEFLRLIEE